MNVTGFTPIASSIGGLLIGLSAAGLLLWNGEIAGISGIVGGAVAPSDGDRSWRLAFLAGLVIGGAAFAVAWPAAFGAPEGGALRLVVAGLLVGFGTRLGSGCTSGHGVCGIARRSLRSIVATMAFMAAAFVTVLLTHHVLP
jgi:uncharacterized membrane protein YedE/YeeE